MGNGRRKFSWRAAAAATWLALACAAHAATPPATAAQGRANRAQAARSVEEGVAAFERGDAVAAQAAFERALAGGAEPALAHTYLGALADRAGDLKAAERHFAAAVEAAPLLASARNNYGVILMRTNRPRLAAAQFEASLKIDPRQPSALVNLAQIRFASGQPEDLRAARDLFGRAHSVAPDAETARALVVVALRLGARVEHGRGTARGTRRGARRRRAV
jgi:Tfp pilus assembly protein PilF